VKVPYTVTVYTKHKPGTTASSSGNPVLDTKLSEQESLIMIRRIAAAKMAVFSLENQLVSNPGRPTFVLVL
jgi:hypothetical protein